MGTTYLKQSEVDGTKKKNSSKAKVAASDPKDSPSMQHEINYVNGLNGIEESLDWIARGISKLTSDELRLNLSMGYEADPVRLTFSPDAYEDTMDRLVTSVERIADSLARLAGLNRPRLESWHEQDEYVPRYKDIAVDGGAPGPKAEATDGGTDNDAAQSDNP